MVDVAGNANSSTCILADTTDLAALQADIDVFTRHDSCTVCTHLLVLVDQRGIRARTSGKHGAALGRRADAKYLRSDRNHMHGQAVSTERSTGSEDTRVSNTAHAIKQVLRDARAVAVDDVAGTEALCGNNVRLLAGSLFGEEGNVSGSARVVLDALDEMGAWALADEVDDAYSALGAAAAMADGDAAMGIAAALAVALFRDGEGQKGTAFVEMVVDGAAQVTHTRGSGLVGAQVDGVCLRLAEGVGNGGRVVQVGVVGLVGVVCECSAGGGDAKVCEGGCKDRRRPPRGEQVHLEAQHDDGM